MDINFAFNVIQSVSVVIASCVAIYGITSWRREAKWKRKYELAEEVLSLFYECRERIEFIRSPWGYVGEGKSRQKQEGENPDDSAILDQAFVFIERYEKEKEPFVKLRSMKFRFMAIYGKEAAEPFDEIKRAINKILLAANRLGTRYWKEQGRRNFSEEQFEKHLKKMEEFEAIVWSDYNESDEIKIQVDNAISKIEAFCKSVVVK